MRWTSGVCIVGTEVQDTHMNAPVKISRDFIGYRWSGDIQGN